MKCFYCNRSMITAAIWLAGKPVGPICARRRGLITKRQLSKIIREKITVQDGQEELFGAIE